jgi:hypothetical protein
VNLLRYRRRTAAWLALAAMTLNTAWPLLANAQPADPSAEICSANGANHGSGNAPSVPGKLHASHCNLCPFGTERGAPVAAVTPAPRAAVAAFTQIFTRGDAAERPLALYPTAPPRAPPVLS